MSKQAKMFQDLLELPDEGFEFLMDMYFRYPNTFSSQEITVIEAMLALADD